MDINEVKGIYLDAAEFIDSGQSYSMSYAIWHVCQDRGGEAFAAAAALTLMMSNAFDQYFKSELLGLDRETAVMCLCLMVASLG